MLILDRSAASAFAAPVVTSPRISAVHDPVDRRHSDLSFSIDTAGRPFYRVLVAREAGLFAPEQAGARNASNFYDSQADGLLPFDGAPCFYLLPRSVLHRLLPATRLYFTLIAYTDSNGAGAAYAHAPERLSQIAPSVGIAGDVRAAGLAMMFGTPVERLLRVGGSALSWEQASEEQGEDLGDELPSSLGLEADDENLYAADDEAIAHAAAADAADADEGEHYGAALADEADTWRAPMLEGSEAAAFAADELYAEDGYEDAAGQGAYGLGAGAHEYGGEYGASYAAEPEYGEDLSGEDLGADDALAGDYDDGYGGTIGEASGEASAFADAGHYAQSSATSHHEHYGAEHEEDGAEAYAVGMREPVPEMLPDEDADADHAALAGDYDDDAVDIDAPEGAQSFALASPAPARRPFDIDACKAVLARIAPYESGREGFSRLGLDGEFGGQYGESHPAYRRFHLGLTFGAFPFVQELGSLGQLLALMRERDAASFERIFGGAANAAALIEVTNSEGPRAWESADGLSPRLRPVAGAPLWQAPWVERFRQAAAHPLFQGAQNELAARLFVAPMLGFAAQLGLDSEAALTLLIDRAVQMGAEAAKAWVLEAASPLNAPAPRQQALESLGHSDLRALQSAAQLPPHGNWDVATHAALIGALRRRGTSAVPIPAPSQMLDALLRHADNAPWGERMRRLRAASAADLVFQL